MPIKRPQSPDAMETSSSENADSVEEINVDTLVEDTHSLAISNEDDIAESQVIVKKSKSGRAVKKAKVQESASNSDESSDENDSAKKHGQSKKRSRERNEQPKSKPAKETNRLSEDDSGIEGDGDSESETTKKVENPPEKKKNVIDKNFVDVSLKNIIRKRDGNGQRTGRRIMTRSGLKPIQKEEISKSNDTRIEKSKANDTKGISKKVKSKKGKKKEKKEKEKKEKEKKEKEKQPRKHKRKNIVRFDGNALPLTNGKYKLAFIIEGHTNINVPVQTSKEDENSPSKDIWCCEFEPKCPGKVQTDVAALAGSYSVLFLDIQQGKYTKKYTHSEIQEIFYTMAWTTLPVAEDSKDDEEVGICNILAVAGRLGSIKLLNPLQNECYRYLFGHKGPILKLVFSKTEPRWLFSASADKTVRLWDIGSSTSESDDSMCLAKFVLPSHIGEPSALSVSYNLSTVMVGCSDGNLVRYQLTSEQIEKFKSISEQHEEEKITAIRPTTIYPSGSEWHEGYIDDMHVLGQDNVKEDPLYNYVVSRGSADMEIVVWNLRKSTPNDIEIHKSLSWPDAQDCTGLRYKVIELNNQKVLIAGDYEGNIRIFNIGDGIESETLPDGSKEIFEPIQILSHEMSDQLIRDVSCSADTRSIIAVDTNNHAFVWRCTDTS
ncbi:hypothetical protein G6F37_001942 [Rhizopus arrhizus]|nr:hypothetical protein G6F38_002133 [Rhizopus arrhizus]KAG1162662.1 hypothetical protein G6F37_001942 [Rhizopus arrhizus]